MLTHVGGKKKRMMIPQNGTSWNTKVQFLHHPMRDYQLMLSSSMMVSAFLSYFCETELYHVVKLKHQVWSCVLMFNINLWEECNSTVVFVNQVQIAFVPDLCVKLLLPKSEFG